MPFDKMSETTFVPSNSLHHYIAFSKSALNSLSSPPKTVLPQAFSQRDGTHYGLCSSHQPQQSTRHDRRNNPSPNW
ncbi:hypothetical protein TanjilG_19273 [Lupinus angustifolius]|uniref:Uncharacterized protein n=1 Tax=Lupinus angustifolius TaxID=3871 RepID=A0A1J7H3H5_LUPAN|nr:hypothetical protein TanjilG_19273 [Lupinus angustifolius]